MYPLGWVPAYVQRWRCGRAVEGSGLKNCRAFTAPRGFESPHLRHFLWWKQVQDYNSIIEFVKAQAEFHAAMAEKLAGNPRRAEKHVETARKFDQLVDYIKNLSLAGGSQSSGGPRKPVQLGLSYEEVEGLPPELIQELSISDGDRSDFMILKLIEQMGGVASLDRILVGIYKQTGEIMKRSTLTSRIYRMTQKGLVYQVPNKKGVYSSEEISEAEAATLFSS